MYIVYILYKEKRSVSLRYTDENMHTLYTILLAYVRVICFSEPEHAEKHE